jgi:hypothetical protein
LNSPVVLTLVGAIMGIALYSTFFVDFGSSETCNFDYGGRTIVNVGATVQRVDGAQPRNLVLKASKPMFQEMPQERERFFYAPCSKNCHPMIRALRVLGWQKVDQLELGRIVFTYKLEEGFYPRLASWQRYNHIPNHEVWTVNENRTIGWRQYAKKEGNGWPYFVPHIYRLSDQEDREALENRMHVGQGKHEHWTLTKPSEIPGKPPVVKYVAPGSKELRDVLKNLSDNEYIKESMKVWEKNKEQQEWTMQKYVCNQFAVKGEKVAIRSFWMVSWRANFISPGNVYYDTDFLVF